jgi:hypothetical protein
MTVVLVSGGTEIIASIRQGWVSVRTPQSHRQDDAESAGTRRATRSGSCAFAYPNRADSLLAVYLLPLRESLMRVRLGWSGWKS